MPKFTDSSKYSFPIRRWYSIINMLKPSTAAETLVAGDVNIVPVMFPYDMKIDALGFNISTGYATGGQVRIGLYGPTGVWTPVAAPLMTESGTIGIPNSWTAISYAFGTAMAVYRDKIYWVALHPNCATGSLCRMNTVSIWTETSGEYVGGATYNQTFGALANPFPGTITAVNSAIVLWTIRATSG